MDYAKAVEQVTTGRWTTEGGVCCVVCPDCAFTFAARHVNGATGAYECPSCYEYPVPDDGLLGLIERHGWSVKPRSDGNATIVYRWPEHAAGHSAPTLIEALTAATNCDRCCGRT